MDNKKIAEKLFKVQMDDLKDAEMLADYAKCIADEGDTSISAALYTRAKQRMTQSMEMDRHIETVMERMKEEALNMGQTFNPHEIYSSMYHDYIGGWTDKIKRKLENM